MQPSLDAKEVSPTSVQYGPLVSFDDAGQQNVLDNHSDVKVREEPYAFSDKKPHPRTSKMPRQKLFVVAV